MNILNMQAILLTGVLLGSLYALMSTGLSMVWGTVRIFNFAHGSLVMLGAYVTWSVVQLLGGGIGLAISVIVAIVVLFGLGMFLERILIAPFISSGNIVLISTITTLAGSIFLENSAHLIWGPRLKQLPTLIEGKVKLLGTVITTQETMMIVAAPLILSVLVWFLKKTRIGLAIRAVEQNRGSALLVGVNVPLVYTLTFGISATLAAVAGMLLGSTRFITPAMGNVPLLKAFIVVILGGLGSLGGTMAGAYIIGFLEAVSISTVGLYWTPAVLFGVMILVMVIRPTGLMGEE